MNIYVTQKDIDKANAESIHEIPSRFCPVAQAIKRRINVSVTVRKTSVEIGDTTFNLPQKARDFINQFDNFEPVKPFHFSIKEPTP